MEREEDIKGGEHPAGPSQPGDEGYAEGVGRQTSEREPDYARGIDRQDAPDPEHADGRFSRGQEAPGTEEASDEGNFARGGEELPQDRD